MKFNYFNFTLINEKIIGFDYILEIYCFTKDKEVKQKGLDFIKKIFEA